ncbi:MAG: amidohydrolase family protein [Kiritimatiellaeota bacterium]|nr:amidohydrolase family protein [Kiritimatiellota bacterium]
MKNLNITLTDLDREIWAEELADFVPETIYDAHTHIFENRDTAVPANWRQSTWDLLQQADAQLFPGRQVHRILFGNPLIKETIEHGNARTAAAVAHDSASIGLALVRPTLAPAELEQQFKRHRLMGVKPYRVHAITGDAVECRITDFLPEAQIEVVNQHGYIVMLHMSKRLAIADPENLKDLERLTKTYPRVKWILAHCARSYYDRPLLKAADRLKNIPNLWYEISSVCDTDAMDVLLSVAGVDRVMYGSDDLAVGISRGKYLTFGHAWCYLTETNHRFDLSHCDGRMTFTRYESLRAFRFGRREIKKLFYSNAKILIDQVRQSRSSRR